MRYIPTHFLWQEYVRLNPDISHINNRLDAEIHWINIGRFQMRLYHKGQLDVRTEFGTEITIYACYFYYLRTNNLLFDNVIITYKGMKDIYYFLEPKNILETNLLRPYTPIGMRFLLVNQTEHVDHFNRKYFVPIPFQKHFQNNVFQYDKPLLILHNKYNIEWNHAPINFFSTKILDILFSKLHTSYHIVYIRPTNRKLLLESKQYSIDINTIQEDLKDYELIEEKYAGKVHTFDDLLMQHSEYSYNQLKLMLYANCSNFINVQGGNAHFATFFLGKMLLLHKKGNELKTGAYTGWYKEMNDNEKEKEVRICLTDEEVLQNVDMFLEK